MNQLYEIIMKDGEKLCEIQKKIKSHLEQYSYSELINEFDKIQNEMIDIFTIDFEIKNPEIIKEHDKGLSISFFFLLGEIGRSFTFRIMEKKDADL